MNTSIRSPIKQLRENPINFDEDGESQVAEIVASYKQNTSLSFSLSSPVKKKSSPKAERLSKSLRLNASSDSNNLTNSSLSSQFLESDEDEAPMTLGCIWSIVLSQAANGQPISTPRKRRHIRPSDESKEPDELIAWAAQRLRSHGYLNVDTGNGDKYRLKPTELALLALLHSYQPDSVDYDNLDPKDRNGNALKVVQALNDLGIVCYVYNKDNDSDHVGLRLHKKDLLTQLAAIKLGLDGQDSQQSFNGDNNELEEVKARDINLEFNELEEIKARDINLEFNEEEEVQERGINLEFNEEEFENEENQEKCEEEEEEFIVIEEEEEEANDEGKERNMIVGKVGDGDNLKFAGREFSITIDVYDEQTGQTKPMALVMVPEAPYLNPAGKMIAITEPNFGDRYQRFVFGLAPDWTTVIDSKEKQGMVWDVADEFNLDPPEGTPFYLFPFHGRHNQHFVYREEDNRIIATQNGQAVTYVGGQKPFVMRIVSDDLEKQQKFHINLFD